MKIFKAIVKSIAFVVLLGVIALANNPVIQSYISAFVNSLI